MNSIKTVIAKELRSYFLSPVALIFLGIFLLVNLFVFFTSAHFFARNIADVRPMFEWMPILLIFLVAAISMRSWSEEQSTGTLEMLMTIPVSTAHLVLGKLLAGMILIAIALALTLPLPIMVSTMGNMDIGPVIGGYMGAFFLAAAYLAMGMCISAKTDNQLVSLMITAVVGALFYMVGADMVTGFFSTDTAAILKHFGSGSRFVNIERGVLDLRDLTYYLSIAAFFVALNIHFIDMKRSDSQSPQSRRRNRNRTLAVTLFGLNAVAINVWMTPITASRIDMTEDNLFSISDATRSIVDDLQEPLVITGFFSEKTHPLLAPLVPGIRDFLIEYQNAGKGHITVKFENPNTNEELEQKIAQSYNIRSLPFRVAARHENAVVNAFFHILVKYGDEYQVLSIDDLVEVEQSGDNVDVQLKNLEYDITRAIKKVSSGFQSIESVFTSMKDPAKLTLYVTPATLPEDFADMPSHVKQVADELTDKSGGKFTFETVDLDNKPSEQDRLTEELGLRPMATDLFAQHTFFLHLLLETGDKKQTIMLQGAPTEAAIKTSIEGAFKRSTPGFMKTIGIVTEKPEQPQRNPNMPPQMQPPAPRPDFTVLERHLSEEFKVQRLQLEDGIVPGDIDVLMVAKTGPMSDTQKFAVDQYLMAGGAVIALVGDRKIQASQRGIDAIDTDSGLKDLLAEWGVTIQPGFVLDAQNASFPVPVQEQQGMFMMRKIKMMDYPFFPDIRQSGFQEGHVATSGLQSVVFNWGSALELSPQEGVNAEVLLKTSPHAWIRESNEILPSSMESAAIDFAPPDEQHQYTLAATLEGAFKSYYTDRDSPLFDAPATDTSPTDAADKDAARQPDRTGRTLKESQGGRLAVVGSSEILSDITASVGDQISGNVYASNFQFARNLIDWTTADTALLGIRTSGAFARTLEPMDDKQRNNWELFHYLFAVLSLCGIGIAAGMRRKNIRSLLNTEVTK